MTTPLEYRVAGRRVDAHGSLATTKQAEITLDTDTAGPPDAFNPAELLLAAIAACMIKGDNVSCDETRMAHRMFVSQPRPAYMGTVHSRNCEALPVGQCRQYYGGVLSN